MAEQNKDTEKSKTPIPKELIETVEENCRIAEEMQEKYWTGVGLDSAYDHYKKAGEACANLASDKSLSSEERSRHLSRKIDIDHKIRDVLDERDYYRSLDPLERQEYVEMKYRRYLKPKKDQ